MRVTRILQGDTATKGAGASAQRADTRNLAPQGRAVEISALCGAPISLSLCVLFRSSVRQPRFHTITPFMCLLVLSLCSKKATAAMKQKDWAEFLTIVERFSACPLHPKYSCCVFQYFSAISSCSSFASLVSYLQPKLRILMS